MADAAVALKYDYGCDLTFCFIKSTQNSSCYLPNEGGHFLRFEKYLANGSQVIQWKWFSHSILL
jgi:hypothetical protein